MTGMRQRLQRGVILLAAAAFLVGLLAPSGAAALTKVKVGSSPLISYAPIFVAIEKGFYKEEGLEVELINFASGAKMISALATGDIQVAAGSASAGLFNSIAKGADFRIVADKGQIRPGYGFVQLIIRKDLLDSGAIKDVQDLAGRRVASHAKGIINDYILHYIAKNKGLDVSKVNLVYMAPPKIFQALQTKSIDAAVTVEPWTVRAEKEGVAVRFLPADKIPELQKLQVAEILYSGKFIREEEEVGRKFMRAYLKGIKYFNARGMQENEMLDIIGKYTKVPQEMIKASIPFYLDNDGKVLVESVSALQDYFFDQGFIKQKLPMEKVVDLRFLK
ncbi:MAG: ABC transporter substrate-binding protein [Candidatus Tectomicrobia bacterium]|nr:ABC transporter substrate-binding protein [Candidatus Tectomicrobia bacterium]